MGPVDHLRPDGGGDSLTGGARVVKGDVCGEIVDRCVCPRCSRCSRRLRVKEGDIRRSRFRLVEEGGGRYACGSLGRGKCRRILSPVFFHEFV